MLKRFEKIQKKLALTLAAAMCMSLSSVPAFAAEASETAASEDGRTTTITTEITWASPEGEAPVVEGASVDATVVKNGKGKKIRIFKYTPKKGYRKRQGHRQPYTKVQIGAIHA